VVAREEISKGDAGLATSWGAHTVLCTESVHRNGTEAQRQRYLPGLIDGSKIGPWPSPNPKPGPRGITTFLVEDGFPGFIKGKKLKKNGGPQPTHRRARLRELHRPGGRMSWANSTGASRS
jgi:isovaleryl-CoA dehydrogenase